jgi:hypothetical protein
MTANTMKEDREFCRKAGMDDFLAKLDLILPPKSGHQGLVKNLPFIFAL